MHTFTAFIIAFIAAFMPPDNGRLFIEDATLDATQVTIAPACFEPPMPDGTTPPCD